MKRTAMVGLLALVSWTAAQAAHDVPGWRAGVSASFTDFDWTDGDTDLIEDSAVGLKLHAQYQFNDWFGIEGAYHDTGEFEEVSTDPDTSGTLNLSFDGFTMAGVLYMPIPSDEIKFYAKAGYFTFDDELSLNDAVTSSGSESGLMAGAGAMIEIADNFGIRADLDWFDAEVGDLYAVNLGVEYFFGGKKEAAPVPVAAAPVAVAAVAAPPAPTDADGDGVVDETDQCPDTPKGDRVGPYGCSCDVTRQLEFGFDSAELTESDKAVLDEVAETLTRLKFVEGTVEATRTARARKTTTRNCPSAAPRPSPTTWKQRASPRAASRSRIRETRPIGDNDTAEGRTRIAASSCAARTATPATDFSGRSQEEICGKARPCFHGRGFFRFSTRIRRGNRHRHPAAPAPPRAQRLPPP